MFLVAATLLSLLPMAPPAPRPAPPPANVVVLMVPDQPLPDGFLDALRIQLIGAATVTVGADVTGDTTAAKLESAATVLDAPGTLAVWVEQETESGYLLYIGSRRESRAVVDVFHIAEPGGPEAVRALALKVREVVDLAALPSRKEKPPPPPPPPPPPWRRAGVVAAGPLALQGDLGMQLAVNGEGGLALSHARLRLELVGAAWWASAVDKENASGYVRVRELGVAARARALVGFGGFAAGGGLGVGMRRASADGRTPANTEGSDVVWLPTLDAELEARRPAWGPLELRAWVGVELAVLRQRFLINELEIVDLGRLRGELGLSLVGQIR